MTTASDLIAQAFDRLEDVACGPIAPWRGHPALSEAELAATMATRHGP